MASESTNLVARFSSLSRQPAARQMRLLLGLAASIALALGMVQWAMEPDFTPLYGELSPASSAEVIRALDASGVRYEVNSRTGNIGVPADRVRELRLQLAGEGLPQGDGAGYDMLYQEPRMGVSSFMEKARFDHALEQELANSIASMDSVRSARVHLALPKQSAFVRKSSKPAASVLLSLYPGRSLSERQLAGVMHLVAYSIPGLEADQVSVVDSNGKLLSSRSGDDFASTRENFRYTRQLEESYVSRITEILTPILGVAAVRAQVAANVDFTVIERTSETYAPQASIRSEQLEQETSSRPGATGVPGTLANQPPQEPAVPGEVGVEPLEASSPANSKKREVRNYELDKTVSHTRETPGILRHLSVAVVVDYQNGLNAEGVSERMPLSAERMAEIVSLVREAVGFDEERGDTVNVVNASFVTSPALAAMPAPSILEQPWFWRSIKYVLVTLMILALMLMVVRPLMKASTVPPAAAPALAPPGTAYAPVMAEGMAVADDRVTLGQQQQLGLPGGPPVYQQQLTMARNMVEGEPERVAHVVKNWMAADG